MSCICCGRCCKRFSFFAHLDSDEWTRVVEHVRRDPVHRGTLTIQGLDRGSLRFIAFTHEPRVDEIRRGNESRLFESPPRTFYSCPFYEFDAGRGVFTCTIHDIKPSTCRKFFCDDKPPFRETMEYCTSCWADDVSLPSPGGVKPCEAGEGCPDLEYRICWFIAHARAVPISGEILKKSEYFIDILQKNIKAFSLELRAKELPENQVKLNLSRLERLIATLEEIRESCERERVATINNHAGGS